MIELLSSSYFPLEWNGRNFIDTFHSMLDGAQELSIATGYCSEESIAKLIGLYEKNYAAHLELIIGMHFFEGFSRAQYEGLKHLDGILKDGGRGRVYLASKIKYHGKVYLAKYSKNRYKSIIGSSNISKLNIMERIYDNDIFTDEISVTKPLKSFFDELREKNCSLLENIPDEDVKIECNRNLFENYLDVKSVGKDVLLQKKALALNSSVFFDIPMKTERKSNLNAFFGKGRIQASGITLPRDWYEVEIIVSKFITSQKGFPYCREFVAYTDDGYTFMCKTSGDYSKNLRSSRDLKILGKWIKGRLENSNALVAGFPVTESVLEKYGRSTIRLSQIGADEWFMDFGV